MADVRRRLLGWAFHLLYHQLAWAYDAVSWLVSLGHWRDWAAAGLPFLPGPRVLELGHGPGHLLVALLARGDRPAGLDLSTQMGRLAARRLGRGAPLVCGRGQALPFAAGAFDGILATFPAPYILAPETIAAVYRVLRPGGRLVIVPEAQLLGGGWPAKVVDWLYEVTGQRSRPAAEDDLWSRHLSPRGFRVTVHQVAVVESLVTLVVAERPSDGLRD